MRRIFYFSSGRKDTGIQFPEAPEFPPYVFGSLQKVKDHAILEEMKQTHFCPKQGLSESMFPYVFVFVFFIVGNLRFSLLAQKIPSPAPQNPSPMVNTTRPHPRIQKVEAAGQRSPLSIGTLYLSPKFHSRPKVPLIVHFHGAPWLVEFEVFKALPNAALVTVQLGSGSGIYSQTFSDPAHFRELLDEAASQARKITGREVGWSSITLTSFSAGYGAIRSILEQPEFFAQVNSVMLMDSLHTSYVPDGIPSKLDEVPLEVFARFAEEASKRKKSMWITHSEVYPGTYASTTETADHLLARLKFKRQPVMRFGPLGMQQLSYASVGNFHMAGFAGNSAPDHLDHFYAMEEWLRALRKRLK